MVGVNRVSVKDMVTGYPADTVEIKIVFILVCLLVRGGEGDGVMCWHCEWIHTLNVKGHYFVFSFLSSHALRPSI
jgi:chitinase